MIWEFKKSIIKFVLKFLFTKSHMLLLLPTLRIKMPGFQLHLSRFQPTFMYILKILSKVKINSVLVLINSLLQDEAKCLTAFKKVIDVHLQLYMSNFKSVCP